MIFPVIHSKRLLLRRIRPGDLASLAEAAGNRQVSRFMPNLPHPYTADDARKLMNDASRMFRHGTGFKFGIIDRASQELVGVVSLFNLNHVDRNAEIGYWIGRKYWGRELASEAVTALLTYAFRELRLHKVNAVVHSANTSSIRLLERLGFVREACWREGSYLGRKWSDVYGYGLLKKEWRGSGRGYRRRRPPAGA